MSTCVILLNEKESADELVLKLREAQTPILSYDLVIPLDQKKDLRNSSFDSSEKELITQINFSEVKLFNPKLAQKDRQKTLALWLMPFGFIAGLGFSKMTGLNTFEDIGFPSQLESFIGGLVGLISGWVGSFFAAGSINQDMDDDLRVLRKRSEQGFWLLILETPMEIELPWNIIKDINSKEIIILGN